MIPYVQECVTLFKSFLLRRDDWHMAATTLSRTEAMISIENINLLDVRIVVHGIPDRKKKS